MSEEVNQPDGQEPLPAARDFPQETSGSEASGAAAGSNPGAQQPGGRRRRRRRKNGGRTQQAEGQNISADPASGETQNRQQQPSQGQRRNGRRRGKRPFNPNGQNQNGKFGQQGQGQRQNAGNGRRRRGRRQVVFVGPMDHSYRVSQGNVPDDLPQNQNGRYRPESGMNGSAAANGFTPEAASAAGEAALRDDAPVRIFCFVEDLFFLAKIQETARKVGVKVAFLKNEKESLAKLFDQEEKPALIVVDLNNVNAKPLQLIPKLRTKFKKGTSILGFVSHVQGDLKMKAQEEGCDVVMPRSAFSQNLPNIFRRHADDEDDGGVQPPGI